MPYGRGPASVFSMVASLMVVSFLIGETGVKPDDDGVAVASVDLFDVCDRGEHRDRLDRPAAPGRGRCAAGIGRTERHDPGPG